MMTLYLVMSYMLTVQSLLSVDGMQNEKRKCLGVSSFGMIDVEAIDESQTHLALRRCVRYS